MVKKTAPPRFDLLFPPVVESEHFRYFENGAAHPFQHAATDCSLVNAWWLAEASLLAYAPSDYAVERFRRAGLEVADGQAVASATHGAQCFAVFNDRLVMVVFRGTMVLRPDRWETLPAALQNFSDVSKNVRADAHFALAEWPPGSGCRVHRGFLAALAEIWPAVAAQLQALRSAKPERPFWFAGHSLGAALATLAAARFSPVAGLYTYGSPRVGDRAFARTFSVPTYRFVNNSDLVARVPPFGPYVPPPARWGRYAHVGQLKFLDADGRLCDRPRLGMRLRDWWRRLRRSYASAIRHVLNGHPWALAPQELNDHAPLLYAIHLWNLLDEGP